MKVKVISLQQPWAHLVVSLDHEGNAFKEVETRSWKTNYRGELYIHASNKFLFSNLELCHQDKFFKKSIPDVSVLESGCIIGKVNLVDCVPVESLDGKIGKQERTFGDYSPGRFAWVLEQPQKFIVPIPAKGALSIWEFDLKEEEVQHA